MDQMKRAGQVVVGDAELRQALKDAQSQMSSGANNPQLGQQILALANAIDTGGKQTQPLKETLAGIATALN